MADQKPTSAEDEYFARENAEKLRKLAFEQAKVLEAKKKDELKQLHHMKCPKCGMDLQVIQFRGIELDRCFHCGVTVFDGGELEKLGLSEKAHPGVVSSILNIFR